MLKYLVLFLESISILLKREETKLQARADQQTLEASAIFTKAAKSRQDANTAARLAANIDGLLK